MSNYVGTNSVIVKRVDCKNIGTPFSEILDPPLLL